MSNGDPERRIFLSYPNTNNESFSCPPLFLFENKLLEAHEYAKMQFHHNISMTSLGDNVREFQYNQWWFYPGVENLILPMLSYIVFILSR